MATLVQVSPTVLIPELHTLHTLQRAPLLLLCVSSFSPGERCDVLYHLTLVHHSSNTFEVSSKFGGMKNIV